MKNAVREFQKGYRNIGKLTNTHLRDNNLRSLDTLPHQKCAYYIPIKCVPQKRLKLKSFYCAFQYQENSTIQSLTDKCVFRYRQSNVRRLLPVSDYCRALFRCLSCAQWMITACSAVVGNWEEPPPNIRLTVTKNAFVGLHLNFRGRMLLKGAVSFNIIIL